jgi:hypothetical protein
VVRRVLVAIVSSGLVALLACSGGEPDGAASVTPTADSASADESTTTTTTIVRPDGPAADLSEEIVGAKGPFVAAAAPVELEASGYVETEHVAAGTATSYTAAGPLAEDGTWTFQPADASPYRTRVLVRRPADPEDFSGTVVVEWLNVSSGADANPDWASLQEELIRQGHAWVGVSAQLIGVAGGPVLVSAPGTESITGKGLVGIDPERYGTLDHPGDGYSFDIFTQVARSVRAGGPAMGELEVQHVLAAGESQSALALTTYYDGVQPLTLAFDGFLVHSRASVPLPLVGPGEYADLARSIGSTRALLRTDLDAPVLTLQSEGDVVGVLNSVAARQEDDEHHRLWEVAGTAHADTHLVGPLASSFDCGAPINDGPMHLVAKAALRSLVEWVRTGTPPPEAERLELLDGATPGLRRDADGIAVGGIRTPPVDVPLDVLSGEPGSSDDLLCLLMGTTQPLSAERIAELYPSAEDYQQRYESSADEAIDAGFVLEVDRKFLLDGADPSRLSG